MVAKLTDKGLFLRRFPIPGSGYLVPFEEIQDVKWNNNGRRKNLVIDRAGNKSINVKGLSLNSSRELYTLIKEILLPSVIQQEKGLQPGDIDKTIQNLSERKGIRPSILLRFLLDQALLHRATDIHFERFGQEYCVRYRIDGLLHKVANIPEHIRAKVIAHIKNAAGLASYFHGKIQEGRLTYQPQGQEPMVIRLSVVPAHGEEAMVFRLFDALRGNVDLNNLGFSSKVLSTFIEILERPQGLFLLSGPSNSGKTTTIYASLKYLMKGIRSGEKAISLEDPMEFPLDFISQIEVDTRKGHTFDKLLSKILRQDVEIIMVGEVRDNATASIAHRAALTGHLILSTVHCGQASEVPRRLVDLGVAPHIVSEAVTGILCQRLLRVICPECKTEEPVATNLREKMNIPEWVETSFKGNGCEYCMNTGYYGRTAIAELVPNTKEISEMIRENSPASNIMEEVSRLGLHSIREDAFMKVKQGVSSLEEIRRVLG